MTAPAQVRAPGLAGASGARWLLDLVDRLHEAFAGPPVRVMRSAEVAAAMQSSDTRAERSARPRPGPRPTARPAATRHPSPRRTEPEGEVDAAHAETWQLVRRAQDGDG